MTALTDYRARIKRLVEAEDVTQAFEAEGFSSHTSDIVGSSKSFLASRSVVGDTRAAEDGQAKTACGAMSQRQGKRRMA